MNVDFDAEDLKPLVVLAVREAIQQLGDDDSRLPTGQLAYLEKRAAELLDIPKHSLRDARLRGEIVGVRIGGRIAYERSELLEYLSRQRLVGVS